MSETKRLVDDQDSQAGRLLRSAECDGPGSPESAQSLALRAALSALPTAPRRAADTAPAAHPSASSRSLLRVGFVGLAAAVTFGGFAYVRSSTTPSESATARPSASAAVPTTAISPAPSQPGVAVEELPSATAPREDRAAESPPARRPVPSGAASTPSRLEDELAAIDAARAALTSGKPDAALSRVRRYQQSFRDGRFAEEADALEVQALAALGRHGEANAQAQRFLARRPGSPYEQRVRNAMESAEVKP